MELGAYLTPALVPLGPVHDRAISGPPPVRGDLLCPLIGRIHRMRPADREVVIGLGRSELLDPRCHELRRLQLWGAVEDDVLVEGALDRSLCTGTVVPDDVVDERVLKDV